MCIFVFVYHAYMYACMYVSICMYVCIIDAKNVIYVIYCGGKYALFNVIYFLTLFITINNVKKIFLYDLTIQDCEL